jgi:hypothetical protein
VRAAQRVGTAAAAMLLGFCLLLQAILLGESRMFELRYGKRYAVAMQR